MHLLFAQESKELNRDIKALIVKIKNAKPSQKRILINQLKLKVQKVNLAKKEQVIRALRQSLKVQSKHTSPKPKVHSNKLMDKEHPSKLIETKPLEVHDLPHETIEDIKPSIELNELPPPKVH